ncbi:MAG: CRISPR-associated helicase/endonuclease Cas3 [Immundisolibacter sp.]
MGRFTAPWAKIARHAEGPVAQWKSLVDHSLDVAVTFRQLLDVDTLRSRLSRLAGVNDLSPGQRDILAVLAGLHDLGKANLGFQNKGYGIEPVAGHLGEILSMTKEPEKPEVQALLLQCRFAELVPWFARGEDGLVEALYVIFSHHGRPVQPPDDFPVHLWRKKKDYDPLRAAAECADAIRSAFPGTEGAQPLPDNPMFMHGLLGVLTLADWIGSDERFFPLYAVGMPPEPEVEESRMARARNALECIGLAARAPRACSFEQAFGFPPNPVQKKMLERRLPDETGSLSILEAETGSGKTEAALSWFLRLCQAKRVDGLYFALPTRAAAVQIHGRVKRFATNVFGRDGPDVVLAVPGYTPSAEETRTGICSDGRRYDERSESEGSWAAEHPKRYMAGQLVVGTVDQVLLSGLQVKHAHMRAAALLRHLLVVDEVHASDPYMARILEGVLHRHRAAGGHALLLSATLGEASRVRFLAPGMLARWGLAEEATACPYPAVWTDDRQVAVTALPAQRVPKEIAVALESALTNTDRVARIALDAAAAGARVGILRNTVAGAIATQRALESAVPRGSLFTVNGVPAPHHGRFAREDRIRLDQVLEERLKRKDPVMKQEDPVVVAATQTIEQSLDIDFDFLITDLCPIDVLLQRLGRLHRHDRPRPCGYESARVVVLIPEKGLVEFLRQDGTVKGPAGFGSVYEDLTVLEGTRLELAERPILNIPGDSRALIEGVLHPDRLRTLAESRGGAWIEHWSRMWGIRMGREATAGLNMADWSKPLSRTRFNEPGEAIRTRLGMDSRRLVLPAGTTGVFGSPITEITVPGWMADGIGDEPVVEIEAHPEGGLIIHADNRAYRYDRFGLRPEKEETRGRES